jgi:hypothetical protein
MDHLILYFRHGIEDIIPWCEFIEKLKPQLVHSEVGEIDSDDMAIARRSAYFQDSGAVLGKGNQRVVRRDVLRWRPLLYQSRAPSDS